MDRECPELSVNPHAQQNAMTYCGGGGRSIVGAVYVLRILEGITFEAE
jgi:hypothetical protein